MLFFRPQKPAAKQGAPFEAGETANRGTADHAGLAPGSRTPGAVQLRHALKLWPAVLISLALWAIIIGGIVWFARHR
jgi:hypothetical protein